MLESNFTEKKSRTHSKLALLARILAAFTLHPSPSREETYAAYLDGLVIREKLRWLTRRERGGCKWVVHGQWSPLRLFRRRQRSGSAPLQPSKHSTAAAAGDLLDAEDPDSWLGSGRLLGLYYLSRPVDNLGPYVWDGPGRRVYYWANRMHTDQCTIHAAHGSMIYCIILPRGFGWEDSCASILRGFVICTRAPL
jgi:hypothetical protein